MITHGKIEPNLLAGRIGPEVEAGRFVGCNVVSQGSRIGIRRVKSNEPAQEQDDRCKPWMSHDDNCKSSKSVVFSRVPLQRSPFSLCSALTLLSI